LGFIGFDWWLVIAGSLRNDLVATLIAATLPIRRQSIRSKERTVLWGVVIAAYRACLMLTELV
jgi:hypothetical protein